MLAFTKANLIMKIARSPLSDIVQIDFIIILSLHTYVGGTTLAEQENEQTKNRISVEIYGHTYKMVGTESIGHMRLVASIVDDKMREISIHNSSLDSAKLAVLTAVNTVHEYLLLKEQVEKLEEELKKLKG